MNTPCDVKTLYDTEFEAVRAATITSYKWKKEMTPYRCGSHWHIGSKQRSERSKKRQHHRTWCEFCQVYMKSRNWNKHTTRVSHLAKKHSKEKGEV